MNTLTRLTFVAFAAVTLTFAQNENASQRAIERANAQLAQKKADYGVAGPDRKSVV